MNLHHWALVTFALTSLPCASAANLIEVSKDSRGEISVEIGQAKLLTQGLVSVTYRLMALETAAMPPRLVTARFAALCRPETRRAETLYLWQYGSSYFINGKSVEDKTETHRPPKQVSLDEDFKFTAEPANVACDRAVSMVKK